MRILQIVADLDPANGIAEVVLNLSDALTSCDVTIAASSHKDNVLSKQMRRQEVRVVRFRPCFPHFGCFSWQMICTLGALVKQADVVHVHGAWTLPVWLGCHYALKHRKPLIRSSHGSFVRGALAKAALKKRIAAFFLEKRYLTKAAVIHATSLEEADQLRAYEPKIRSLAIIPNGVEGPERRLNSKKTCKQIRTVLFLGRLNPVKGLSNLITAWGHLRSPSVLPCESSLVDNGSSEVGARCTWQHRHCATMSMTDGILTPAQRTKKLALSTDELLSWQLVIAGPDNDGYQGVLERLARDQVCLSSIIFAGPVYGQAKWKLYQDADLFVLPTLSENFGLVVGEALACGVPVITTKGAPWVELLGKGGSAIGRGRELRGANARSGLSCGDETGLGVGVVNSQSLNSPHALSQLSTLSLAADGRCGWWVDIGVAPLVEALREALSLTDEVRQAMGENGRRLVEVKYQWTRVAEEMAAVYRGVVKD
jgi:glycosyltransferase involved in cell wall biosynthesis